MLYKKTSEVDEFFRLLWKEQQQFNWDLYAEAFKPHYKHNSERDLQIDIYVSCFLAYHRIKSIQRIKRDAPELNVSWLERASSNEHYIDNDLSRRCFVYPKNKKFRSAPEAQYDNILVIDGTPTIMRFRYRYFPRQREERSELVREIIDSWLFAYMLQFKI